MVPEKIEWKEKEKKRPFSYTLQHHLQTLTLNGWQT